MARCIACRIRSSQRLPALIWTADRAMWEETMRLKVLACAAALLLSLLAMSTDAMTLVLPNPAVDGTVPSPGQKAAIAMPSPIPPPTRRVSDAIGSSL